MRITSNYLMALPIVAASIFACTNKQPDTSFTKPEQKVLLTGEMNTADIFERQSARDNLSLNMIDIFDSNHDGKIDSSEVAVFNATDIIENTDDSSKVTMKINLNDGTKIVTEIAKGDKTNIKDYVNNAKVASWSNIPQIKENSVLKDITYNDLETVMKDNKIKSPAIITMTKRNSNAPLSQRYDYMFETFENKGNSKLSVRKMISNSDDTDKIVFNYKDSSVIESTLPYTNPLNPKEKLTEETFKNNWEVKKYYTKDSPYDAQKTEYYLNDSLVKTEENNIK